MKILLAVDGSELALQAVRHALQLVREGLKASFVVGNVQEPATLYEVVTAHDPDVLREVRATAGADLVASAEALLDAAGVDYETEVASGDPANVLVEMAERNGCDAIVMGAHGSGDLSAALLGSVSHAVLKASPVPVTFVRERAAETDVEAED
ncbi:MAG TPA: universal stress protein [Burkholderiaceae bacterium]|nr:universal stress protein [Burkholderiaceae bacterium]HMX10066.1 universal stress protein [Burkholderiaceae bacterium]HMZ02018.1 universal stress protein [Burkholderiaceae bacterium]HNB44129.1 universal stress protein [Burkholderiaceae bacterium]HNG80161.1 universal stress protein [Burkholderiaceae bacterium]